MTSIRCATVRVFLVCCIAVACSVGLFAQGTNARITGIVTDQSKAIIRGAQVIAINEDTGVRYPAQTNSSGIYIVSSLIPGTYRVEIQSIGFKTVIKPGLVLHVQDVAEINFEMAVGSASESVTVSGSGQVINTTDASVGTVVDRKFVENLPLNGRSFQDLIALTLGVVTQSPQSSSALGSNGDFSVNGQRTESNYYTVDGVSANGNAGTGAGFGGPGASGSLASSTAVGTTQSLLSVDALQEFRVQTSTYSAEYGRSPGGQFAFATRAGTSSFHGSFYDYLRNDYFDANDWFNDYYSKAKSALRQNDFGGTFGGPASPFHLSPNTHPLFFLASYEGLRLTQPQAASVQYVPDATLRNTADAALKPILAAFPQPNGIDYSTGLAQFIQSFSVPSTINSSSARFDYSPVSNTNIFFRIGYTPSRSMSRTLSSTTATENNTTTYTVGISSQFTSNITNEFRVGYLRGDAYQQATLDSFGGAVPLDLASQLGVTGYPNANPIFVLSAPTGTSSLFVNNSSNRGRQWNTTDTLRITHAKQLISLGADLRSVRTELVPYNPLIEPYFYSATSLQTALQGNKATALYIYKANPGAPIFYETAAFAQDEWRAHPRLSVSAGIRWELNPPLKDSHGKNPYVVLGDVSSPSTLYVAPANTPLWHTAYYNFAPRLGVAWLAHNESGHETVVRAGGGVFFDTNNNSASQTAYLGIGYRATATYTNASLPITAAQLALTPSANPPYTSASGVAFPVHRQLPYTLQWNVSLQQAFGSSQSVTISYVASAGRRLNAQQQINASSLNPTFGYIFYYKTGLTSAYDSLQLQYQRTVRSGLHALASYVWSHSLDYGSNDIALALTRGNSDFDVRHNVQAGLTWDLPSIKQPRLNEIFGAWGLDVRASARTGFPITISGGTKTNAATGSLYATNANLVAGQSIYLYGSQYPGGRAVNKAAFSTPTGTDTGNAPRNFVRGFGAAQLNLAAHRDFPITEHFKLQFRAETFNVTNHPNFGYITPTLSNATFGQATKMLNQSLGTVSSLYQQGGPRSFQFALRGTF